MEIVKAMKLLMVVSHYGYAERHSHIYIIFAKLLPSFTANFPLLKETVTRIMKPIFNAAWQTEKTSEICFGGRRYIFF